MKEEVQKSMETTKSNTKSCMRQVWRVFFCRRHIKNLKILAGTVSICGGLIIWQVSEELYSTEFVSWRKDFFKSPLSGKFHYFFQRPRRCRPLAKSHIFFFPFLSPSPGDLYWIGSDKSCSTLIGRHKLSVVQMHVHQPLTKLWCLHLLNPAM